MVPVTILALSLNARAIWDDGSLEWQLILDALLFAALYMRRIFNWIQAFRVEAPGEGGVRAATIAPAVDVRKTIGGSEV